MYKKDLVSRATQILKNNNIRKPVQIKKNVFHISDEEGNYADFTVKQQEKEVIYTVDDVNNILDAILSAVTDAIKSGEEITLRGFGTLSLVYRAPKMIKKLGEDDYSEINGRFVPKFQSGSDIKMAAKVYELKMNDKPSLKPPFEEIEEE